MNNSLALPYLDSEALLQDCLKITNRKFESLRYSCFFYFAQVKCVVTAANDREMSICLPESGRVLAAEITSLGLSSALLGYFGERRLRILIWARMPTPKFTELLREVESCGFKTICCHESHAILQYPRYDEAK